MSVDISNLSEFTIDGFINTNGLIFYDMTIIIDIFLLLLMSFWLSA